MKRLFYLIFLVAVAMFISACNFNIQEPTPTVENVTETITPAPDQATETPIPTITSEASSTPRAIQLESPVPTNTPLPPTMTATPTETPGPYEHTVAQGETLGFIVQLYGGYSNLRSIFQEIVALNLNVPNENSLPVGQVILIPRQTATPTPQGFELTATAYATRGLDLPQAIPTNAVIDCYEVQEGETIISIAEDFNTTIEILSELNPDISFLGCDFNNRSGGENCIVSVLPGQCVQVPYPTPTPSLSPTPSGNETATPTPTYAQPRIISPPQGWTLRGVIPLQWVSIGLLEPDEYYYVEVTNTNTGEVFREVTKATTLDLPLSMMPPSGESHQLNWFVSVVSENEDGSFKRLRDLDSVHTFKWETP